MSLSIEPDENTPGSSMGIILSQALKCEDNARIEEVIIQMNRNLIDSTIKSLPVELTVPFLNKQNFDDANNPIERIKNLLFDRSAIYSELTKLHGVVNLNINRFDSPITHVDICTPQVVINECGHDSEVQIYENALLTENQENTINKTERIHKPKKRHHSQVNGFPTKKSV